MRRTFHQDDRTSTFTDLSPGCGQYITITTMFAANLGTVNQESCRRVGKAANVEMRTVHDAEPAQQHAAVL
jgi:hypothetical protein